MKQLLMAGGIALALAGCGAGDGNGTTAVAANNATAAAEPTGTIADGLGNSRFAAAVRAAGLEQSLKGAAPSTVLVPGDQAFAKLPPVALQALMAPENKEQLVQLLTGHVLPGSMLAADINKAIDAGGGKALMVTMAGDTLTATREGSRIVFTGANGARAAIAGPEQTYANGVVHPVNTVLMPVG